MTDHARQEEAPQAVGTYRIVDQYNLDDGCSYIWVQDDRCDTWKGTIAFDADGWYYVLKRMTAIRGRADTHADAIAKALAALNQ